MSRGHDRERAVRKLLEAEGWWTARAAGSLGDADIIAMRSCVFGGCEARLVEVKSTSRGPFCDFGPADRRDLSAAASLAGAEAWLCWWPPRGKPRWIAEADWPKVRSL